MESHVYQTRVRWTGERRAALRADGLPDHEVATPPEFPGGHPGTWSPEHLYTAAAEACLMTTFLAIAANSKLAFASYESTAEGTLEKTGAGYLMTRIVLRPKVVVLEASQVERARHILEKAEKSCLISNSMKTQVEMVPDVTVA